VDASNASYWGVEGGQLKGSELAKNEQARAALRRLLSGPLPWVTVHWLPPSSKGGPRSSVLEVREPGGNGSRWTLGDGGEVTFRGFLEGGFDKVAAYANAASTDGPGAANQPAFNPSRASSSDGFGVESQPGPASAAASGIIWAAMSSCRRRWWG